MGTLIKEETIKFSISRHNLWVVGAPSQPDAERAVQATGAPPALGRLLTDSSGDL